MVRKPGGPGYEIKMLTDRIVNRSFELADILDWGFPIKSSELAGGNLEATLKEILGPELGLFFRWSKIWTVQIELISPWGILNDFQKLLNSYSAMVYDNQLDFQKMHSIYMPWYHKYVF